MAAFSVAGYDVLEMLGFGASAEVWLARDRGTGDRVALKRMRSPADPAGRARFAREATALTAVRHQHVVRMRRVIDEGDSVILVLDHAAGGSLASLLSSRGGLRPGEVVTLAVPLAQALAEIAAVGLVHGDISPGNVLFSTDGQPLLSDFGVAQILGACRPEVEATEQFLDPAVLAGAAPGPASDVYALAAVCLAALGSSADGATGEDAAVRAALRSALSSEPSARPTAEELAVAVFDACPAQPILIRSMSPRDPVAEAHVTHRVTRPPVLQGRTAPGSERRARVVRVRGLVARARPQRLLRPVALGLLMVVVALLAVRLGAVWAASDDEPSRSSAPHAGPPASYGTKEATDWIDVLRALDATRSAAFARADPARLERVYADGSPAVQRDRELLAQLVASGSKARGLRLDIRSVRTHALGENRVVLKVADVLPRYHLVAADGTPLAARKGRPLTSWLVTLVRGAEGWRVYDVVRA